MVDVADRCFVLEVLVEDLFLDLFVDFGLFDYFVGRCLSSSRLLRWRYFCIVAEVVADLGRHCW